MKSIGLFGKKGLQLEERQQEIGAPGPNQVIVKVRACGVCGTDINFVRDWPDQPMALGHELAGEVVETGQEVTQVKPGDRVIVEDCSMCGGCEDCKNGQPDLCRQMFNLENQPGMGQYLCVRHNQLNRFEGLDDKIASLTEPLAVAVNAVLLADIPLGGSVVVLGNGPLGLMVARLAKLRGAGFVGITGLTADLPMEKARFALAPAFGCDLTIETLKQSVEDVIKKRFPNGVDRIIVSSPPHSMLDAFKIIRYGGVITFFGLHFGGKNKIEVDVNDLIFRKIALRPSFAEPAIKFPVALRLLKDGLVDGNQLVTHTFGFDNAKAMLAGLVNGTLPVIKAVMLPHGT